MLQTDTGASYSEIVQVLTKQGHVTPCVCVVLLWSCR